MNSYAGVRIISLCFGFDSFDACGFLSARLSKNRFIKWVNVWSVSVILRVGLLVVPVIYETHWYLHTCQKGLVTTSMYSDAQSFSLGLLFALQTEAIQLHTRLHHYHLAAVSASLPLLCSFMFQNFIVLISPSFSAVISTPTDKLPLLDSLWWLTIVPCHVKNVRKSVFNCSKTGMLSFVKLISVN